MRIYCRASRISREKTGTSNGCRAQDNSLDIDLVCVCVCTREYGEIVWGCGTSENKCVNCVSIGTDVMALIGRWNLMGFYWIVVPFLSTVTNENVTHFDRSLFQSEFFESKTCQPRKNLLRAVGQLVSKIESQSELLEITMKNDQNEHR